ncbi:MAG: alpha-glucan family phosphorylase, partial [Gemmatimonadaceae bacterium]
MNNSTGGIVAYFSMEICLEQAIPTYSGGLGVLAGDTLRSAADLYLPMVAVSLVHRKGYFVQTLDANGQQHEAPEIWSPEKTLPEVAARASVSIAGRRVAIRAFRYEVVGAGGHVVPVFLLDTNLDENSEWDRTLTDSLYGGDAHYRLCQEVVLGMGGAAILDALGYADDAQYHINEGHAALLTLTLLERELAGRARGDISEALLERVRHRCIFTTHTPVPAGHDRFDESEYKGVLGDERAQLLLDAHAVDEHELNMTHLALRLSRYVNGVA